MIKDKKGFFFKTFFAFIAIYIVVSMIIMSINSDEDFSFQLGKNEDYNSDWFCENTGVTFSCPNTFSGIKEGEDLVISKKLPENMDGINCLLFKVNQGAVRLYIDGELRKEYDDAEYRLVSKFPPSATLLAELNSKDAGKTAKIVYNCFNKNYLGSVSTFIIGDKDAIVRSIIIQYFPMLLIALFLILFGALCVVLYFLLYRESPKNKFIVYLGIFLAIIGLWLITSSRARQLFFGDITTLQYLELWLVHILPIPFVFFCDIRCGGRYRKFSNVMLIICYTDFVVSTLLHFTGIVDKAYTFEIGHVCTVLVAVYFVICNILDYRKGYKKESAQILVSFLILSAFSAFDVGMLYVDRQWMVGVFLCIGIIIFSLIILTFAIKDHIAESRIRMAILAESEAKEQFFATMSHDIRTPINAIIGMNEIIQRESKEESTLDCSRDIQRASDTLMSIVNDILDFSKIKAGKNEIINTNFSFMPMIADVIKMTKSLADNKGLRFETDIDENIPSGIIGDENAIKRILTNLTSNAIKYTKDGSVGFAVRLLPVDEDTSDSCTIRFEVKDTGMGIKKEDIPYIFDAFSRMDKDKNKRVQGTGLGLSITSALAESMGSKINVQSVYGEGSVFSFDVRFKVTNAAHIGKFSLENARIADTEEKNNEESVGNGIFFDDTKTILVVDDTPINLKVISKLLEINGVKVVMADSGDKCIEYIMGRSFDMILLDDMMPDKDGKETLKELKTLHKEAVENVPVIALTANAGPGAKDTYISLGFTDYMSKPVTADELNKMLWKFFG